MRFARTREFYKFTHRGKNRGSCARRASRATKSVCKRILRASPYFRCMGACQLGVDERCLRPQCSRDVAANWFRPSVLDPYGRSVPRAPGSCELACARRCAGASARAFCRSHSWRYWRLAFAHDYRLCAPEWSRVYRAFFDELFATFVLRGAATRAARAVCAAETE